MATDTPLRHCQSSYDCCICHNEIVLGQYYFDGTAGRAHMKCAGDAQDAMNIARERDAFRAMMVELITTLERSICGACRNDGGRCVSCHTRRAVLARAINLRDGARTIERGPQPAEGK